MSGMAVPQGNIKCCLTKVKKKEKKKTLQTFTSTSIHFKQKDFSIFLSGSSIYNFPFPLDI